MACLPATKSAKSQCQLDRVGVSLPEAQRRLCRIAKYSSSCYQGDRFTIAISRILADRHLNMGVKEDTFNQNLLDLAGDRRSR